MPSPAAAHMNPPDSPRRGRRTSRILLLVVLAVGGLGRPGVARSAGPCGWLVGVSTWTGNLSFSYGPPTYADPLDGTQYDIRHGAIATFELAPFSQGPGGITWQGLAT